MSTLLNPAAVRPPGPPSPSFPGQGRRWLRALAWALALLLGLPALLLLAWVLSNLSDLPEAPRPPALQVPAPAVAAERNAHFRLQAVRAPGGADAAAAAAAAAQAQWLQVQAWSALASAQRFGPTAQPLPRAETGPGSPAWQAGPSGSPWVCDAPHQACAATWLAQAEALAAQRATAAWGARCTALLEDPAFAWEEPLPRPLHLAAVQGVPGGAADCSAWFLSGAVVAHARGDSADTLRQLGHADRLHRALQAGSHSLLGQALALRLAHQWLDTSTALALRDPSLAAPLAPMLEGWPQPLPAIGRWVAFESSLIAATLDDMFQACAAPATPAAGGQPGAAAAHEDALDAWAQLSCRHRIGLQRERTLQASDARWLQHLAVVGADWPASAAAPLPETPAWRWRNTLGQALLHASDGAYTDYTRRHADLALHLRAAQLALALQREAVPPAARADWLARQPLHADERARLQLQEDGQVLALRLGLPGAPGLNAEGPAPLRIALPR